MFRSFPWRACMSFGLKLVLYWGLQFHCKVKLWHLGTPMTHYGCFGSVKANECSCYGYLPFCFDRNRPCLSFLNDWPLGSAGTVCCWCCLDRYRHFERLWDPALAVLSIQPSLKSHLSFLHSFWSTLVGAPAGNCSALGKKRVTSARYLSFNSTRHFHAIAAKW